MENNLKTSSSDQAREQIALTWLIRLRWWAIFGQILLLGVTHLYLKTQLPWANMSVAIVVVIFSNLGLMWWTAQGRPSTEALRALTLSLDVIILTIMLELSGGASNPFSFLYLVHVALAAVSLGGFWCWILVGESFVLSSYVFGDQIKLGSQDHMGTHLLGMWVAFLVSASFIVYFVRRIRLAMETQDKKIQAFTAQNARQEKLAALATLSAGAAHELATPLSTIAVAARELELSLQEANEKPSLLEDTKLIRHQVQRCSAILEQMSSDSGNSRGEVPTSISLGELIDDSLDGIESPEKVIVQVPSNIETHMLTTYPRAVSQAIRCLIKNAIDASEKTQEIKVMAQEIDDAIKIEIMDEGSGIDAKILSKVTEPFFTTKNVGEGMGLGLFLTQSVMEQIGGKLDISSTIGVGTQATLTVPGTLKDQS